MSVSPIDDMKWRDQSMTDAAEEGTAVATDRRITEEEARVFREEGAVVLRDFLSEDWLRLLERGYEDVADLVEDTGTARDGTRNLMKEGTARASGNVARFLRESPAGQAAADAMGSAEVRLYEDLLFVKEAGGRGQATPWHQDSPHWPVKGAMMGSFWVSLEPTSRDTGSMAMVIGSHRGPLYTPNAGSVPEEWLHLVDEEEGGPLPDPGAEPGRFPVRCYETERGDAVLFHPSMLHSAPGRGQQATRRTFTFRFLGDDIRWYNRTIVMQPEIRALDLKDGDRVLAPYFPVVWPADRRTI